MNDVPARRLLLILAGFTIWALAFVALYGVNAIGCRFDWPASLQRSLLLGLLALHLLALAMLSAWTARRWRHARQAGTETVSRLIEYLGFGTALAASGATVFVLAPTVALSLCN